ncbi:PREDICTED: armadillo repeat-containing protein 2 [Rhagoletis zephyria]|uniref:armadillo repeat-containing protein 2 n=2 Tax=Rhagoletis zephyria TaxID=28612 RepID=UPI0008116D99|nr:PREDICTED: armadillo repeat-containing protein 2 [Rhagoletis zephyria]
MILLKKRRSQSESRKVEHSQKDAQPFDNYADGDGHYRNRVRHQQQITPELQKQIIQSFAFGDTTNSLERRKTSAQMISEAKSMLAEISTTNVMHSSSDGGSGGSNRIAIGGVRVVSTRRPITPREPGRALYGKVALAGRPPSAFSLRYLQNESQRHAPKTPALEPIPVQQQPQEVNEPNANDFEQQQIRRRASRRSNSWDERCDYNEVNSGGAGVGIGMSGGGGTGQAKQIPRKLPALEVRGVSLEAKQRTDAAANREHFKVKQGSSENSSLDLSGSNKAINILSTRKFQQRNCHLLAQSPTEKLIGLLKEHAGLKECSDETANHINSILVELYTRVRKNEKHYKRGFILGGLYGLVECSSPKILLGVARVVLALRVTGSNLTGACKLIFKVARNEQNDQLFHDNDLLELLIDGLGRASPLDDPEACIYGYGSIRFLTSSTGQDRGVDVMPSKDTNRNWAECLELPRKPATAPAPGADLKQALEQLQQDRYQKLSKQNSLVERLARHGGVELMVLHLQILNEAGATQKLTGPPLHSLYQLSAALRALSDVRQTTNSMEKDLNASVHTDLPTAQDAGVMQQQSIQLELACPHLVRAAEVATGELEVQANIVRTLSVLSEDSDCCHVLVNFTARIGMLLGPCCEIFDNASEKLLSLFSRLGYILGNIMAKYDNARVQFFHNDVAMQYLLRVLELYSKEPLTLHNSLGDTVIDVLVKMIRVVANMSVNAEVGIGLGNTHNLGIIMLNLLNAITHMKAIQLKSDLQELLHATLGALHNLCFYQEQNNTPAQALTAKGSLQCVLGDLATALFYALKSCRDEASQVETARVLGNLTRNDKARRYFCRNGGLALIVQQLSATNTSQAYDFKACAIGVLVNLLGDAENRAPFMQHKGPELLHTLLGAALQEEDWFLATIICQAMWNLLIDASNVADVCQEQILDDICDLLVDYLDEERLFEHSTRPDAVWEGFAIVATDLLERIQASYDKQELEEAEEAEKQKQMQQQQQLKARNDKNNGVDGGEDDEDDVVYIEEM